MKIFLILYLHLSIFLMKNFFLKKKDVVLINFTIYRSVSSLIAQNTLI